SEDGRDYYRTVMRRANVGILPGKQTTAWTFDGRFPGPTIKVKRGREVVVRRVNRLDVPTTTHLHGGRVRPVSDGQPLNLVHPGEHFDYVYPNDQDAATLWYHDHTHHHTSRNNYMGLSGLYIIEDDAEDELNLPAGKYDIPLIVQDRSFRSNGQFRFRSHHDEVLGDTYLVNGRPVPFLKVANRKYRFRILNASLSRGYNLALDTGHPLVQIASDQGLLTTPRPAASIPLWPAERAEVVLDFSLFPVGTRVVLQDRIDADDPTAVRPIMCFDVEREETDTSSLPLVLKPIDRLVAGSVERHFELSFDEYARRWEINGKPFDPNRIDARPRLGDTETWTFQNSSSVTHPMHLHLVRFQVQERNNLQLTSGDLGWKDTVRVDPSSIVKIVVRFEGYSGRYMFHCHNLAHEDQSMMGQMKIVR
ncbi:MAG TPA: multicopper oxidase family protein, partial [Actinomycetota bacterium]|nr:multicopper oxidase family protein [Actinomycetota bacterium]